MSYKDAIQRLVAAQATVHIISYTTLVRQAIEERNKRGIIMKGDGVLRDGTPGGQDPMLPPGMTRSPSVTFVTIDTDRQMRRWYKKYAESAKESEGRLVTLAGETGGKYCCDFNRSDVGPREEVAATAARSMSSPKAQAPAGRGTRRRFAASRSRRGARA